MGREGRIIASGRHRGWELVEGLLVRRVKRVGVRPLRRRRRRWVVVRMRISGSVVPRPRAGA